MSSLSKEKAKVRKFFKQRIKAKPLTNSPFPDFIYSLIDLPNFKSGLKESAPLKPFTSPAQEAKHKNSARIKKNPTTIASYWPLPNELPPPFFAEKKGWQFVFPKTLNKEITFVSANPNKKQDWVKGPWPFSFEPAKTKAIELSKIHLFFVPGLAFDREGQRLGRGMGCYDRVLSKAKGLKIGLARGCQISLTPLPVAKHDVRMDALLTENFLLIPNI